MGPRSSPASRSSALRALPRACSPASSSPRRASRRFPARPAAHLLERPRRARVDGPHARRPTSGSDARRAARLRIGRHGARAAARPRAVPDGLARGPPGRDRRAVVLVLLARNRRALDTSLHGPGAVTLMAGLAAASRAWWSCTERGRHAPARGARGARPDAAPVRRWPGCQALLIRLEARGETWTGGPEGDPPRRRGGPRPRSRSWPWAWRRSRAARRAPRRTRRDRALPHARDEPLGLLGRGARQFAEGRSRAAASTASRPTGSSGATSTRPFRTRTRSTSRRSPSWAYRDCAAALFLGATGVALVRAASRAGPPPQRSGRFTPRSTGTGRCRRSRSSSSSCCHRRGNGGDRHRPSTQSAGSAAKRNRVTP